MGAIESVLGERKLNHETLTVHVGPERETCLVRLGGELDLGSVPILDQELDRLSAKVAALTIDLESLQFIDSSGLHCLARAARHSQAYGHELGIRAPNGDVERIIEVSGIGEVLPMVR